MKYLRLMRVQQWYKNLVIFLPLVFAGQLYNTKALLITFLGFLALCLVSSASYIINDIIDKKKDRLHPEKRKRPIASGTVRMGTALIFILITLGGGLAIAYTMPRQFMYAAIALFVLSLLYTLYLRNEPFADILTIAVNFVIRAVAGALIINVRISPWLILCTFFLSLFLSIGKRSADLYLLKDDAVKYRETYKHYDLILIRALMIATTVALIMSYSLYSFLSIYIMLIISLPFAMYVIFRFMHLVHTGHVVARQPEKFFHDTRLTVGIFLWILTIILIIY